MTKAGKLDRSITITRSTGTSIDINGVPVETWSPLVTLRAELVEASIAERMRSHGASTEASVTFRTRFYPGVTVADRVSYGGAVYNIKAVQEIGRRRGLELKTERLGP